MVDQEEKTRIWAKINQMNTDLTTIRYCADWIAKVDEAVEPDLVKMDAAPSRGTIGLVALLHAVTEAVVDIRQRLDHADQLARAAPHAGLAPAPQHAPAPPVLRPSVTDDGHPDNSAYPGAAARPADLQAPPVLRPSVSDDGRFRQDNAYPGAAARPADLLQTDPRRHFDRPAARPEPGAVPSVVPAALQDRESIMPPRESPAVRRPESFERPVVADRDKFQSYSSVQSQGAQSHYSQVSASTAASRDRERLLPAGLQPSAGLPRHAPGPEASRYEPRTQPARRPAPSDCSVEPQSEPDSSVQLGDGTWGKAYTAAQHQPQRRRAFDLLCRAEIVTHHELADSNCVIGVEHIDECVQIAASMLEVRHLEDWLSDVRGCKANFDLRLNAKYRDRYR